MAKAGKKDKFSLINFKITNEQKRALWANARKFSNGNLSKWLRIAGTKFRPTKKDLA